MTVATYYAAAYALGFKDATYDLSDRRPADLVYLHRLREGQHQYLSLMNYEGRFLEALVEIFAAPRNPRDKKQVRLSPPGILRSWAEIEAAISRTYALPKP